jgi:beta-N-acetylhexosaminidase
MPKAIILGCAGPSLSEAERRFFGQAEPYGFILFKRNIVSPAQVLGLVQALRESVGRADAPILIDQEGGRVARLGPPNWPSLPPARKIGQLAERNAGAGIAAARALGRVIGAMLAPIGIDVACAPVADLLLPETHGVIGDRALAMALARGLRDAGVTPIVKHIPGHGRATADSHLDLPRIATAAAALEASDFAAFRTAASIPWAMVAHCVYEAYDAAYPASISASTIGRAIRGAIDYQGVLIADDIGMKALSESVAENAMATLAAGCDLTLHCSGDLEEMQIIAPVVGSLRDPARQRLANAAAWMRRDRLDFDPMVERALLDELSSS